MTLPSRSASVITAIAKPQQNFTLPQFVFGGRNASAYRVEKITTTYSFAVWRSGVYRVGRKFDVLGIRLSVFPALTTNMTIIPVLYFDNARVASTGTTINSTNYSGKTEIVLTPADFTPLLPNNLAYDGQSGNFTAGL